jgi:hypothetical protein
MVAVPSNAVRSEERRAALRIRVSPADAVCVGGEYRLLDISRGGFALESADPFSTGGDHRFEFALLCGLTVTLQATVVHAMRASAGHGTSRYITGFALMELADGSPVDDIIDAILEERAAAGESTPSRPPIAPRPQP